MFSRLLVLQNSGLLRHSGQQAAVSGRFREFTNAAGEDPDRPGSSLRRAQPWLTDMVHSTPLSRS